MGFSSKKVKPNNVNTTSATTLSNKSIKNPTRYDVKKDNLLDLQSYATTASNGQFCYDTDNDVMYQVLNGALDEMVIYPTDLDARVAALEATGLETQLNGRFNITSVDPNYTLSNSDLTATYNSVGGGVHLIAAYIDEKIPVNSGKYYVEFRMTNPTFRCAVGGAVWFDSAINPETDVLGTNGHFRDTLQNQYGFFAEDVDFFVDGSTFTIPDSSIVGTKVTLAIDNILNEVYVAINGIWQFGADPVLGTGGKPFANLGTAATSFNFGVSTYNAAGDLASYDIETTPSIILADYIYVG